jgi:hypothetical protein
MIPLSLSCLGIVLLRLARAAKFVIFFTGKCGINDEFSCIGSENLGKLG